MMKLAWSGTSPYVRKATILIAERGLENQVERVTTNPWDPASDLPETNPVGRVPALTLADGTVLTQSWLICDYLDGLPGGPRFIPGDGPARLRALRQEALADGLLDSAIAWIIERVRRPAEFRWPGWETWQRAKIERAADAFEAEATAGALADLTIGTLTLGVALGYLDFRFDEVGWRQGRPTLAAWYETIAKRPSFVATVPKA